MRTECLAIKQNIPTIDKKTLTITLLELTKTCLKLAKTYSGLTMKQKKLEI